MATLLLIEDSLTDKQVMTSCLQESGHEVISVNTAEAALAILQQTNVDGIILDVVLPGKSDFGLCRELKNNEATASIPIILCSSKSERMDVKWGLRQGADDYIPKPIDRQLVTDTVSRLVAA